MSYGEVLANINQEGLLLKHIPESSRNIKMCQIAIKQNKAAEKYVPENLMIIINDLKKEAKIMWEYNRRRYT